MAAGCFSRARAADTPDAVSDQNDWERFLSGSSGYRRRVPPAQKGASSPKPSGQAAPNDTKYDIAPEPVPPARGTVGNFSAPLWVVSPGAPSPVERPQEIHIERSREGEPFDNTSSAGLAAKTFMLGAMTSGMPYFFPNNFAPFRPSYLAGSSYFSPLNPARAYAGNAFYGQGFLPGNSGFAYNSLAGGSFFRPGLMPGGFLRPYAGRMNFSGIGFGLPFRGAFFMPGAGGFLPAGFYGAANAGAFPGYPFQQSLSQWGWNSNTRVMQTGPSPSSGNYYSPASSNSSSSGSYYSAPAATQLMIPSSSDNPPDYWGPQGNPFAEQINK